MIGIDFTVLEKNSREFEYILIFTVVFTKLSNSVSTRDTKATTLANILVEKWLLYMGIPQKIRSDQGRNFESARISELCRVYEIDKCRTTAYSASGDGQCERFNQPLHALLRPLQACEKTRWSENFPALLIIYNTTLYASTSYSPYYLTFGSESKLPIDFMLNFASEDNVDVVDQWLK